MRRMILLTLAAFGLALGGSEGASAYDRDGRDDRWDRRGSHREYRDEYRGGYHDRYERRRHDGWWYRSYDRHPRWFERRYHRPHRHGWGCRHDRWHRW
jgi:hypothetical protein